MRESQSLSPVAKGEVKAAGINTCIRVLREMVGPERFERFVDGLAPDQASLARQPPFDNAWLPLLRTVPFFERALQDLFGGDEGKMFELGRRQIREDLTTIYRMFIRVASPSFIAARTAKLWETYARDAGRMRLVREEPGVAELALEDYPARTVSFWPYMRGCIHGVLELTGAREMNVRIVEGGVGAPRVLFRATWK